jgi:hypothetical protein
MGKHKIKNQVNHGLSAKTIVIGLLVCIALIVGFAFITTAGQKPKPATASYSPTDNEKPIAEANLTSVDLGEINLKDIKQQDFTLTNTGTKPLQIIKVTTSCGCTSGQIIYNGQTSKEYSMHSPSDFVTEIAPGGSATVRLTYRPATMPVYGPVERAVYVSTNDPANPNLVFSVKASVK